MNFIITETNKEYILTLGESKYIRCNICLCTKEKFKEYAEEYIYKHFGKRVALSYQRDKNV